MVADKNELGRKSQGTKARWESDLRSLIHNAIIKFPAGKERTASIC